MLDNFMTVAQQVGILFILICIGVIAGKTGLIKKEAIPSLNNFVLYIVTIAVMVKSFNRPFDKEMLAGLGLATVLAIAIHVFNILLAHIIIHDKEKAKESVMRFAAVFSNCGFMAIPLQSAILGDEGVFFGAVYIAIFNILCWTYGLVMMSGDFKNLSLKKVVLNPGVIGVVVGIILFLTSAKLPELIYSPISYLAALNTPLPMVIIGFMLWQIISGGLKEIKKLFAEKKMYVVIGLRIIVVPLLVLFILKALDINSTIMQSMLICASAPVAATTTMFAEKFGGDSKLSVAIVSISTIFSLITMPVIISIGM